MSPATEIRIALSTGRFDLSVDTGWDASSVALFGPSGSGKTTILEVLAGVRQAGETRIVLYGERIEDSAARFRLPPEKRGIGWVPQDASLFPHLSVEQNLRFGMARSREGASLRRAIEVLEIEPLLSRRPAELSGGEGQRVALARALASGPRLLLLDEPLASLDLPLRARIFPDLLRLRDRAGIPILYVTHDPGEALALARHVLVLDRGRIAAAGSPEELLRSPAAVRLLDLVEMENRFLIESVERPPEGPPRLRTRGGIVLHPAPGFRAMEGEPVGVRADDIIVAIEPIGPLSAQNRLSGIVVGLIERGGRCLLEVESSGERIHAAITQHAARSLGVSAGMEVTLLFKAAAVHTIGELGGRGPAE